MGLTETSIALAICVFVLAVAVVLDRRPYRPGKFNYIPLMIIALAAGLVFGRHLLGLILYQSRGVSNSTAAMLFLPNEIIITGITGLACTYRAGAVYLAADPYLDWLGLAGAGCSHR